MKRYLTQIALLASLSLLLAAPALAHWPTTVAENLSIASDSLIYDRWPVAVAGTDGRTLVAFFSGEDGVCYQVVDKFGNFLFPIYQPITPASSVQARYGFPHAVADSAGGMFVAWTGEYPNWGIYGQRLDSLGNRLWGDNGAVFFPTCEYDFDISTDGQGGFFLAVGADEPGGGWADLWVQRISGDGVGLWGTQGVLVCGIPNSVARYPRITHDGAGGCLVTWEDSRNNMSVYAQHLDNNGNRYWLGDLSICNDGYFYEVVPDGQGGMLLHTDPGGEYFNTCFRISGQGYILWNRDHVSWWPMAHIAVGEPGFFYFGFHYDLDNGAAYGQRMDVNGNLYWPSWPANYGALIWSRPVWLIGDDQEFVYRYPYFYAMIRERPANNNNRYLFLQRLDSLGNRTLGYYGGLITTQYIPHNSGGMETFILAPHADGGVTAVWELYIGVDYDRDVYAKRVNADGTLGGPFPLNVALTPHSPPVQIPPSGGTFIFDVAIADTDSVGGTMDAWIEVTLANGRTLGILARNNLAIQPNGILSKNDLQQFVPPGAPAGIYTYTLYAGNHDYNSPWGQDSFTFEKLGGGGNTPALRMGTDKSGWIIKGWDEAAPELPTPLRPVD